MAKVEKKYERNIGKLKIGPNNTKMNAILTQKIELAHHAVTEMMFIVMWMVLICIRERTKK